MQTQVTWIFKHRNIIARIFSYLYTYDEKGNPDEYTYPSGYTIKNEYKTGNGALQSVKDKQNGRIIYAPGSFNARGQMLYYALANAGIHAAIAGGITYGADALVNNTAFNWKAYGLNVATSMALAGLSYQKPGAQPTNYSRADLEAAGITDPRRGYGMRFGGDPDSPYKWKFWKNGGAYLEAPVAEIVAAKSGGGGFAEAINTALDYSILFPVDMYLASFDFYKNYSGMRQANWKDSDKYFHAKANFQATHRGPGGEFFAEHFSNLREIWD